VIITVVFGALSMVINLAFLDLAAKSCPPRVEATFFAALMSVYNLGVQLAENVGARLYDVVGYEWLVYISAAMTALTWALMPLVKIDRIEAKVREEATADAAAAAS
jgi:predicted MFS family arabinose efflux permease